MTKHAEQDRYDLKSRRRRFLGLDKDQALKGLFGGNALVSIIVLALITIFLFKEGAGFFGQYRQSIELYRESGIEYVDLMSEQAESFAELKSSLAQPPGVAHRTRAAPGPWATARSWGQV